MSVLRAASVISRPTSEPVPPLRLLVPVETDAINASAETTTGTVPSHFRLQTFNGRLLKRGLDLCIAIPVVLFALPLLCVIVKAAQIVQSAGPLLYCQKRCGRDGGEFTIFKFRTMDLPSPGSTDLEENPGARIYPIGKILRRSKLDEIPQFINVLLGTMSVVGPRPHHYDDCQKFSKVVGDYSLRSVTKPGITGLAQYTEYRGDFEWNCVENRVVRDLTYIHQWSIVLDVLLILKTASIVCRAICRGALRRLGIPVTRTHDGEGAISLYSPNDRMECNSSNLQTTAVEQSATIRRAA